MNRKDYTFIAGAIFLGVMLFHIFRIILGWRVEINGFAIPAQWSLFAAGIAGGMAIFGLGLSKGKR